MFLQLEIIKKKFYSFKTVYFLSVLINFLVCLCIKIVRVQWLGTIGDLVPDSVVVSVTRDYWRPCVNDGRLLETLCQLMTIVQFKIADFISSLNRIVIEGNRIDHYNKLSP